MRYLLKPLLGYICGKLPTRFGLSHGRGAETSPKSDSCVEANHRKLARFLEILVAFRSRYNCVYLCNARRGTLVPLLTPISLQQIDYSLHLFHFVKMEHTSPAIRTITVSRRRNGLVPACEPCRKAKVRCDYTTTGGGTCSRCKKRAKSSACVVLDAPMTGMVSTLFSDSQFLTQYTSSEYVDFRSILYITRDIIPFFGRL